MFARIKTRLREARAEDGFTLIEVLMAAVILALASAATFGVLSAATRNAQRAQATQVALDKAQEEIEKLHAIPYSELALEKYPEHVPNSLNPNFRVNGEKFAVQREPLGEEAIMVRKGGSLYGGGEIEQGPVKPGPIPFDAGNVSGEIYRYIVWRNDPTCPESEVGTEDFCPGKQDYKQLIVAVKLDKPVGQTAETSYVEVQSQVNNPDAQAQRSTQGEDPGPSGGEPPSGEDNTGGLSTGKAVTAQQFFLSDTPCSSSGLTMRQSITGDHLLHNTRGVCASGPQTGETPGAPDALLTAAPPDPAPADESNPPLYDYSSDSYLEPNPDTDKGVQLIPDDTAGCLYHPSSTVNPEAMVHTWVTDPMPREFKLSGTTTLEFYSRTLNEASYPATVCVYLFERGPEEESPQGPKATDVLKKNGETGLGYWTYSSQGNSSWPRTGWEKLRLTMKLAEPFTIPAGNRLGVAIGLEAGTTGGGQRVGIQIMYDHPNYPSRLEVDTTTPFEEGS